jgi:hypothetical protein
MYNSPAPSSQRAVEHTARTYLLVLLAIGIFFWAAKYHPFLALPLVFDDDARHHVYWTYTFQDRDLFRHDLLTEFISSPRWALFGYRAVYFIGAQLMDPLLFSQVLSLLLLSLSTIGLFSLGQHVGGNSGGACIAFLFMPYFLYAFSGGIPHSFALPLLIGFAYFFVRVSFGGMSCLMFLTSLFYPPVLLNALPLAALAWWRNWRRGTGGNAWGNLVRLIVGVGLAGGLLVSVYVYNPTSAFGRLITRSEARTMPELSAQGRSPFYSETWLGTVLNDRWGLGANRLIGFVLLIVPMVVVRTPARFTVPGMAKDMMLTSLIPYVVAHLVLFRLHNPSRYVLYTLPLAALLIIAANVQGTLTTLGSIWPRLRRLRQAWQQRRVWRWVVVGLVSLAFVYVQNRYIVTADPISVRIDATLMPLYAYLQTLPKDVVIAGHPTEMDNIPLLAQRKVLANQELALPYYTGYYGAVRQRLSDMLLAYYADEVQQVQDFVARYGVDYILLNTRHFEPEFLRGPIYDEPFHSLLKPRLATSRRFVLRQGLVGKQVYAHGPYILLSFVERPP